MAKALGQKIFDNFTLVTSCSNDPANYYQQGGTCTRIMDRTTGRIIETDSNSSRQDQCQVTVVTAYCPCKQSTPGESIANAQQHC
eukprot:9827908-Ditylum_brightwellii.AAC.1